MSESQTEHSTPVDYEHEHEHGTGQEPEQARAPEPPIRSEFHGCVFGRRPSDAGRYPLEYIAMPAWKFISRTLLALTAFAALALASVRVGGLLAAITVGSVAVFAAALTIVALNDRSSRRAFAIGFLVPIVAYSGIHLFAGGNQLNPFAHSALATRSLGPLYNAMHPSRDRVVPDG